MLPKGIEKKKLTILGLTIVDYLNLGDKWVALVLHLHLRRRCTYSNNGLVIGIVNSHGLAWAKWTSTIMVFHKRGESLTVLPFSCYLYKFWKFIYVNVFLLPTWGDYKDVQCYLNVYSPLDIFSLCMNCLNPWGCCFWFSICRLNHIPLESYWKDG